jgi:hypothetical protein
MVNVEIAGMGIRRVRMAKLPPEVQDGMLLDALSKCREVKKITEEQWSRVYRYPVSTGARLVDIGLKNTFHRTWT